MIGTVYFNDKPIGHLVSFSISPIKKDFYAGHLGRPWVDLPAPPANASILVSRNKREGRYLGWRRDGRISWLDDRDDSNSGHQRAGATGQ